MWVEAEAAGVYPGQVYWVAKDEGGYDATLGWSPGADWPTGLWLRDPDAEREPETTEEAGYDTDLLSIYGWRLIAEHTGDVIGELDAILSHLGDRGSLRAVLILAARWHDWGKVHEVFQNGIKDDPPVGFDARPSGPVSETSPRPHRKNSGDDTSGKSATGRWSSRTSVTNSRPRSGC